MENAPPDLVRLLRVQGGLTPSETTVLTRLWQHEHQLRRNEFLSTPDRTDRYLYFVLSGALRIYCVNLSGEEVCLGFSYTHSLAGSYPSLILQKPAAYFVQAISASQLLGILWDDFVKLAAQLPSVERCRRMLSEDALIGRLQREIEMLSLTPTERYERFMQRSAHLFQLVPQKYIASYLNMSPETLSRIRSKKQDRNMKV